MKRWLDRYARLRAGRIAARLAPHLPPAGLALDIGSGTGHNAEALRAVTRLEFKETDVVDFHVVGPGPILCGDARLPFADGSFDAATLCYVLHYATDAAALLREAARVARRVVVIQSTCSGRPGRAFLTVREFATGRLAFHVARAAAFVPQARFPLQVRRLLTRADVRSAASRAGLTELPGAPAGETIPAVSRDLFVLERTR